MINCIIVEDEPVARNILKKYIGDVPSLNLVGECKDAISALDILNKNKVDLIFLDINMPKLTGISFLKSLRDPPGVILTTAYSEFALESYELNVLDYLLKPFSFERFLKAINKAESSNKSEHLEKYLFIKADGKSYKIELDDILLIESKGDYVTLHTHKDKFTYYETLKSLSEKLPQHNFIRIHRSYIISFSKIEYIEGNVAYINKKGIPIGNAFKETLIQRFNN